MRLGPWKFVLLYGVLAGGGSMSIITLLLLMNGTRPGALKWIPIVICLFLVGGAAFGLLLWKNLASNYAEIKEAGMDHLPDNQTKETVPEKIDTLRTGGLEAQAILALAGVGAWTSSLPQRGRSVLRGLRLSLSRYTEEGHNSW